MAQLHESGRTPSRATRRFAIGAAVGLALAAGSGAAIGQGQPQAFPSRPITVMFPYSPSPSTTALKLATDRLGERWKQPIVVDFRPGAYMIPGIPNMLRAPADGHTIGFVASSILISQFFVKVPYDVSDVQPITRMTNAPWVLFVSPSLPVKSFAELVAYSKSKPGGVNWGIVGAGGAAEIVIADLKDKGGFVYNQIVYKGNAEAVTAVAGQNLDIAALPLTNVIGLVKDGKLKLIGTTSGRRQPELPDVPAIAETIPGWDYYGWTGLIASSKVPKSVIDRWNRELREILAMPDIEQQTFKINLAKYETNSPEEFAEAWRRETAMYARVAKQMGLVPKEL